MPLPPAAELGLSDAERKQLIALGRHRSSPRGIVLRSNNVLGGAEGLANRVLARKLSTSVPTVLLWRKRFESDGIAGILEDPPRSGRPKRISAERESAIVEATMKTTPKDATQWSVRAMAAAQKISSATRSEEHTSELQSHLNLVCRLLLEKKKKNQTRYSSAENNADAETRSNDGSEMHTEVSFSGREKYGRQSNAEE